MNESIKSLGVHINETLDTQQIAVLGTALRELDGVVSVRFHSDDKHIVFVSYHADQVTSQEILNLVTSHPFGIYADFLPPNEIHAQLYGS
ncbi:MAG: hypothetical protein HQL68_13310 [Magnetococcales bacterium]|nr:hypothetical protein [Magnetococcales bacterium]